MVQPAVLAVVAHDPGGELERGLVGDGHPDGVADLGQVVGVHPLEQGAAQVVLVGREAHELEAGPVADAGDAGAVGQPQQHRRLVDQPVGAGLAGAGVGEVEDLREQVVGPTAGAVHRGQQVGHPVVDPVGAQAAQLALARSCDARSAGRPASPGPRSASAGSTKVSKRRPTTSPGSTPTRSQNTALACRSRPSTDQAAMATGVASKTEDRAASWRVRSGVPPDAVGMLSNLLLRQRLFSHASRACPSQPDPAVTRRDKA